MPESPTAEPTLFDRRPAGGGSLLNAGEVAHLLGVPRARVYEQSRRGTMPTVTLGRYRRYRREAILEWISDIER